MDNNKEQVDNALAQGADLNKKSDGETALINAVKQNNFEMVKYLVSKGADVNVNDGSDYPITLAVKNNNFEITKFLLDKGASLKKTDTFNEKETIEAKVVFKAAENDNLEIIKEMEKSPNANVLVFDNAYGRSNTALEAAPEGSKTRY